MWARFESSCCSTCSVLADDFRNYGPIHDIFYDSMTGLEFASGPTYCLDYETHENLVTAMPGTPPAGEPGEPGEKPGSLSDGIDLKFPL